MSLSVGKVIRGPVVPKTEMFILFYYILSIDLPSHSCLCFTCPLFLLPSVSSVWVTALDGSLCVCILTSDSPSLIWFSLYVSYSFCLLCISCFSLPHLEIHLATCGITSPPAHSLCLPCLTWVVCLGPLPFTPLSLCDMCFPQATWSLLLTMHSLSASICTFPAFSVCLVRDGHQVTNNKSVSWQNYPENITLQKTLLLSKSDSEPLK